MFKLSRLFHKEETEDNKIIDSLPPKEKKHALRLKDADPNVRNEALYELAELGSKGSIPLIKKMLEEEEGHVYAAAFEALAKLGYKKNWTLLRQF